MLRTAARELYRHIVEVDGIGFIAEVNTIAGPVGVLVTDVPDRDHHAVAAGVLVGLEFSPDLAADIAKLNRHHTMGGLFLSQDITGDWWLVVCCRIQRSWLDPATPASHNLVRDVLRMLPRRAFEAVWYVTRERGRAGSPWPLHPRWWVELIRHI